MTILLFLIAVVGIAGNHLRLTQKDPPWVLQARFWLRGLLSSATCLAFAVGIALWFQFDPFADGPIDPRLAFPIAWFLVLFAYYFQPVAVKIAELFWKEEEKESSTQINYTQGWVQVAVVIPLMITGILVRSPSSGDRAGQETCRGFTPSARCSGPHRRIGRFRSPWCSSPSGCSPSVA